MMARPEDAAGMPGLVEVLGAASQDMAGAHNGSESETVSLIVRAAAETVPGADHAGVTLLRPGGEIVSQAVSHDAINAVDQLQATYREGPCVTALWDEHTVAVEDMAAEASRWPRFAPEAVKGGIGSMLSFQLFAREDSLGALNLYAGQARGFTADSHTLGGLFAMHAAAALGEAQHIAQLHHALETRDVIGQAKGVLMERFGIDAEQAFAMLVRSSQQTNMKLVAVAQWLTGSDEKESRE